jgi:hypothetical protein
MTNQKWEVGPVKLVNGYDASIFSFDEIRKVYLGWYILPGGGRYVSEWWEDGRPAIGTDFSLAPPPKKTVRVQLWINVYADGHHAIHASSESALAGGEHARFACIEFDRVVEEGEGL